MLAQLPFQLPSDPKSLATPTHLQSVPDACCCLADARDPAVDVAYAALDALTDTLQGAHLSLPATHYEQLMMTCKPWTLAGQ